MSNVTMSEAITLDEPVKRGEQEIATVQVRKPKSGELRGTNLTDLLQMDVVALNRVLPRITVPNLTEHEVAALDPADLMQLGTEVSNFLLPKRLKAEVSRPE